MPRRSCTLSASDCHEEDVWHTRLHCQFSMHVIVLRNSFAEKGLGPRCTGMVLTFALTRSYRGEIFVKRPHDNMPKILRLY